MCEEQPVLSCIILRDQMSVDYCFDDDEGKERSHGFCSWVAQLNSLEPKMNKAECDVFVSTLNVVSSFSVPTHFVTMYYGFGIFCRLQYIAI